MFDLFSLDKSIGNNYTTDDPRSRRRLSLYESSIWGPASLSDRNVPLDLNMVPENFGTFDRSDRPGSISGPVPNAAHNVMPLMPSQNQQYPEGMPMNFGATSSPNWSPSLKIQNTMFAPEHSRLVSGDFPITLVDSDANHLPMQGQGQRFAQPPATSSLWNESPWRTSFPQEANENYSLPMGVFSAGPRRSMSTAAAPVASNVAPGSLSDIMYGVDLNSSPLQPMISAARRHSYNEGFGLRNQNENQLPSLIQNHQQNQLSANQVRTTPQVEENHEESNAFAAVHEYFSSDPHERVKVTKEYLEHRYFDEEKYLGDLYQLPKFPVETLLRNYLLVLVGFKAGRIDVFYIDDNVEELQLVKVGDLVIVEADRGRDLGKVVKMNISIDEARLLKLLQFLEQQAALSENVSVNDLSVKSLQSGSHHGHHGVNPPPTLHFPKSVVSLAQPNDILQILNKNQDEEKACRLCLAKIASTTHMLSTGESTSTMSSTDLMQMKLIDAEYQFDRRKLIFYYSTSKRIDFRDLVRELFRIYKTRIWMCAVNGIPYVPQHHKGKGARGGNQSRIHGRNLSASSTNGVLGLGASSSSALGGDSLPNAGGNANANTPQTTLALHPVSQGQQGYQNTSQMSTGRMDRRISYQGPPVYRPQNEYPREYGIPRHYHEGSIEEESGSLRDSGESLVLKLLVDTLNH